MEKKERKKEYIAESPLFTIRRACKLLVKYAKCANASSSKCNQLLLIL